MNKITWLPTKPINTFTLCTLYDGILHLRQQEIHAKKYIEENVTFDWPVDFVAPPFQLFSYFLVNAVLQIYKPLTSWWDKSVKYRV